MLSPMTILAIMAVVGGSIGVFKFLADAEYYGMHPGHAHLHGFFDVFTKLGEDPTPFIGLIVALAGIGLAYAIYKAKWISAESIGRAFAPLYTLFSRKYYMDELYERIIVVRLLVDGLFYAIQLFDTYVVDGIVNGLAKLTMVTGGSVRKVETGQLQTYGLVFALGVIIIMVIYFAAIG
jgi:NADH-quinone oxidoreductase subunit L